MASGRMERSGDTLEKTELFLRLTVSREQQQEETQQVTNTSFDRRQEMGRTRW